MSILLQIYIKFYIKLFWLTINFLCLRIQELNV